MKRDGSLFFFKKKRTSSYLIVNVYHHLLLIFWNLQDFLPKKGSVSEGRANSGSLQPCLTREKAIGKSSRSSGEAACPLPPTGAASTSTMGGGRAGKREEKQKPSTERKHRRCWSADLHRRFVHALQQLGGPHGTYQIISHIWTQKLIYDH